MPTAAPRAKRKRWGRPPPPALAVRRKGRLVKRLALEASGQCLYKSRELGLGEVRLHAVNKLACQNDAALVARREVCPLGRAPRPCRELERHTREVTAVAVDLDLSLIQVRIPNLELRKADIVAGPVERGAFDLVTARAVLHHVADARAAIANMVASLKVGGALLLIEPDFLPVSVAEPQEVRAFWDGWLAWSRERGIDYQIGRTLAPRVASLGLTNISGTAETAIYNGGSLWADYWIETITELRADLISSGKLDEALIDRFLECCADSNWWTETIAFTAVHGLTRGA